MKSVRLKFFIFINIILLIFTFAACNNVPASITKPKVDDKKVVLRCVLPSNDKNTSEAFKTFAADIKTLLPDYDIHFDFVKGDAKTYQTKIKVLLSSDKMPDVFLITDKNFSKELMSSNLVQPLEKYLEKLNYWDMVIPSAKVAGYHGHIYAVPFDDVSYQIIEVNTELFKENNVKIPQNFSELQNAVSIFKSKGIIPIALGGNDGQTVFRMLEGFAYTVDSGISLKIAEGREKFSDETFKQSAEKVKELITMGAFDKNVQSITDKEAASLFYKGKAAMYCTLSSDFNTANQKLKGKCGIIYYPSLVNAELGGMGTPLSGGVLKNDGLFIANASKHPEDAVKLAIEMSKYYNRYLYEKQNNAGVIYIPDKLDWKSPENTPSALQQFMKNEVTNVNTSTGLLQSDMSSGCLKVFTNNSSVYMSGLMSVDEYVEKLDNALKLK